MSDPEREALRQACVSAIDWLDHGDVAAAEHHLRAALSPGPEPVTPEGFIGHKPLSNGKCEHRWRNRTTHIVTCRYADGWHAGQVAVLSPGPEPVAEYTPGGLRYPTVEELNTGINDGTPMLRPEPVAGLDRDALYRRIHALPKLAHYGKGEQCYPITDAVLAALGEKP